MNKLKIVLLYPFLAAAYLYGMEQEVKLSAQPTTAVPQQPRVPSLKHLMLSKIGSLLLKEDKNVSISALEQAYPGAQADCAQILAEDERVTLWNKCGNQKKTVELDHCSLIANGLADEVKENTVYAALFTPDDRFLLTLSCKKDVQANYVLNVWRVSDFSPRLARAHAADVQQQETAAEAIEFADTTTQTVPPINKSAVDTGAVNQEMTEQHEPLMPCSEFVIRPMNYCIAHMFNVICDPSGSLVVLTLPFGDCYFLSLSPEGIISRLYRLNILPLAKELRTTEGAEEENQFYQDNTRLYVKLLAFNSTGKKLLIHLERNPDPETAEKRRGGPLYCFPIENHTTFFSPAPVINILDETYKIADDVDAAVWRQDDTISFFNIHDYTILHTVTTEGEAIGTLNLCFEGIQKKPLCPSRLQLKKNSNTLVVFSNYIHPPLANPPFCVGISNSLRVDYCNLENGDCIRMHDKHNAEDTINFIGNDKLSPTSITLEFLSNENFVLKIFVSYHRLYVQLWDIQKNYCANVFTSANSDCNASYALSADGSSLYIADHPRQEQLCKYSKALSLQTPLANINELKKLIAELSRPK